jgi:tetratricopeptide (TPR) repeat protein
MRKYFLKIATVCLLIVTTFGNGLFAQKLKGAPVKKERLIKALRSRQFQTRDIVTIISSNGVDFQLTAEVKQKLIAAGARPEVIQAIANNSRVSTPNNNVAAAKSSERRQIIRRNKPAAAPDYDDLLEQALSSYKDQQNPMTAVRYLKTAMKLKPNDPAAYQMMGFINLYGLNDLAQAEQLMRESIENGGSAVFRVYHDDNGKFTGRCTGSLYISPESIRFESTGNVDRIKFDRENTREWKNRSIFKVFLKIGNEKARFRFAPISGAEAETQMVGRFINESKPNTNSANLILDSPQQKSED